MKKKTFCKLCAADCRIEVETQGNDIIKIYPDYSHPRTQGYVCPKHTEIEKLRCTDPLTVPLKKVNGEFVEISWEQAIGEISNKILEINKTPSDYNFFLMQTASAPLQNLYLQRWLEALGMQYKLDITGIEKSYYSHWSWMLYGTPLQAKPDFNNSDVAIVIGANPVISHQETTIRKHLNHISSSPNKTLIVIDPVKSETAEIADEFIQIKPGTDAWFLTLLIIKLHEVGANKVGFRVDELFDGVDQNKLSTVCGISIERVTNIAKSMKDKKVSVYIDTGIDFSIFPDITTMLSMLLYIITGNFNQDGGNIPVIGPYVYATEILNHKPDLKIPGTPLDANFGVIPANYVGDCLSQFKSVFIHHSNPANRLPNSKKIKEELSKVELVVVIDAHFTETCKLADYILPVDYVFTDVSISQQLLPTNTIEYADPVIESTDKSLADIVNMFIDKLSMADTSILSKLQFTKTNEEFVIEFSKLHHYTTVGQKYRDPLSLYYLYNSLGKKYKHNEISIIWYLLWQHCIDVHQVIKYKRSFVDRKNLLMISRPDLLVASSNTFEMVDILINTGIYNLDNKDYKKYKFGNLNVSPNQFFKCALSRMESIELTNPMYKFILSGGFRIKQATNGIRNSNIPLWVEISPYDADKLKISNNDILRISTEVGSINVPCRISSRLQSGYIRMPNLNGINTIVPTVSTAVYQQQFKYIFANVEKV